jgi:transposase
MPRHISETDRARIAGHLENGRKIVDLAAEFGIGKSSVGRIKKKWENERSIKRNAGSGRKRCTNALQNEALITFLRENPMSDCVKAINETNFPASRATAYRRINESRLSNYSAARKPFLKNGHKEQRVGFAIEFLLRNNIWDTVVFSDEKTFKSCYDGRVRVYRPRNTWFEEQYTQRSDHSGRFSVNVWGWISAQGPGALCVVEERLNANVYIRILNEIMLPSVVQVFPHNNYLFQQDHCSIHTSALVQNWIRENNINILQWLSRSPDFNPI